MARKVAIAPGSAQHLQMVSPSKVPAILGISRWESQYSLWHRMAGDVPAKDAPMQDIFEVGLAMEMGMAELYKMRHPGWKLSNGDVRRAAEAAGISRGHWYELMKKTGL